ncbi:MAG: hypothetical protein ABIU84_06765 [Thermoanaerobaculia bacterium]
MTTTTLRRKKDHMYGVIPSGSDYLALSAAGAVSLYIDGTFVSLVRSRAIAPLSSPHLIRTDSGGKVGDNSLVYATSETALEVWDVAADTLYTHTPTSSYQLVGAVYSSGKLYWIECEPTQHGSVGAWKTWYRLMQANCDLTGVTEVSTHELVHYLGFSVDWGVPLTLLATPTGLMIERIWDDNISHENTWPIRIRVDFDGSPWTDSGWANIGSGIYFNPLYGVYDSFALGTLIPGSTSLGYDTDDVLTVAADLWSAGGAWNAAGFSNASTSPDGTEAALYSAPDPKLVRGPASVVVSGEPTSSFVVGIDGDGNLPICMWIL